MKKKIKELKQQLTAIMEKEARETAIRNKEEEEKRKFMKRKAEEMLAAFRAALPDDVRINVSI